MTNTNRDWAQFALLLIDVQRDFWPEKMAESFPNFPANVTRLLALCRGEGLEVVHLRARFKPDMSDWMLKYRLRGRIPCVEGTDGVETLPFAVEGPGEKVITKQTFDGFHCPDLLPYLKSRGKRFLLTAGLVTSTCVLFTTSSATQLGFLTAVIGDCCADEPLAHEHTLERYQFVFERTTVEQIVQRYSEWLAALGVLDQQKVAV
jgi:nicotinamidase-related amidase